MKLYLVRWDRDEQETSGIPGTETALVVAESIEDAAKHLGAPLAGRIFRVSEVVYSDTTVSPYTVFRSDGE